MPAPKNNKNALGNTGGKSLNDRKLAAEVRSLALSEIKKVLQEERLTEFKKQVILRLAPSVLPKLNEHTGKDGDELFPTPILNNMTAPNVHSHNSNSQDSPTEKENPGDTGRDLSQ